MDLTRYVGAHRDRINTSNPTDQSFQPYSTQQAATPDVRAEGGPMILPSLAYQQRPKPSPKGSISTQIMRPSSSESGSRSPRFHEHLHERNGCSSRPRDNRGALANDSPTLGRLPAPGSNASLADDIRHRQHLMPSSDYDPALKNPGTDGVERMTVMIGYRDSRAD